MGEFPGTGPIAQIWRLLKWGMMGLRQMRGKNGAPKAKGHFGADFVWGDLTRKTTNLNPNMNNRLAIINKIINLNKIVNLNSIVYLNSIVNLNSIVSLI